MNNSILIIDDEKDIRISLRAILEDEGYQVFDAENGSKGLAILLEHNIDLIFLDIWFAQKSDDGFQILENIKINNADLPVIMISGHGNVATAVEAMKKGAFDFVEKPFSLEKILISVKNALLFATVNQENRLLRSFIDSEEKTKFTGNSTKIELLKKHINQVAPLDSWVLITGENGTGKEVVAKSLHSKSKRANLPIIAMNCAAIPEDLIESELFGHERGAFTGAERQKKGKFELAHKGTLFLDEIADMSLKTQAKILRIIQEQRFERVGGDKSILVDVRVIAATNKILPDEIAAGRFREDLYYRLKVFPLEVPALRERVEDLLPLIEEFIKITKRDLNLEPIKFTSECFDSLKKYNWPGNVRELKNFVERMSILYAGQSINSEMLPAEFSNFKKSLPETNDLLDFAKMKDFKFARSEFEIAFLKYWFEQCNRSVKNMADAIGLERSYLYRKLSTYKITDEE